MFRSLTVAALICTRQAAPTLFVVRAHPDDRRERLGGVLRKRPGLNRIAEARGPAASCANRSR
ncbi:MAG: hypothetical protein L0241_13915, partial [Planctomycetia bacterium]|nr:hypothetical protein [Planctomycetia bacterium]